MRANILLRVAAGGAAALVAAGVLHGCASVPADPDVVARAATMMKASVKGRGQAELVRLGQGETQALCSE
jgi:hypothetical protein